MFPEMHVGCEKRSKSHAAREILEKIGWHVKPGHRHARAHNNEQSGQDAPRATLVETPDRIVPAFPRVDQNRGNQVAGDDKKHVDADISAAKCGHTGMEKDHRHHGDCAQPIYFASVFQAVPPMPITFSGLLKNDTHHARN